MPYVRKFARKTYTRRRPARKLNYRQKKEVKRMVNSSIDIEYKFSDTAILLSPTSGGIMTALSAPTSGTGSANRVGDNITLKSFEIDLNFVAGDNTNIMRCVLFRWSQNNAATAPTATDLLQYLNPMSPLSHESLDQGKIQIIYDAIIPLVVGGSNQTKAIRRKLWGRKIGRKKLVFNTAGATTGTYMPYLYLQSDSSAAPHPSAGGYIRYNYTDQ